MYVAVFHLQKQKNRPGQRTRQKQWEAVFGSKAKHLQKRNRHQRKKDGGTKSHAYTRLCTKQLK